MNNKVLGLILSFLYFTAVTAYGQNPFITVWKTDNAGGVSATNQIRIPFDGNYTYVWEQIGNPSNNGSGSGSFNTTIAFPAAGTYRLRATPTGATPLRSVFFGGTGDCAKIIDVEQWGDVRWTGFNQAFHGTTNLINITASDVPDLSGLTDTSIRLMFSNSGITTVNNINNWNMSTVTGLDQMFSGCPNFNSPIGDWNVSNVKSFIYMFYGASSFNQPVGDWDVSGGIRFDGMFSEAFAFNQPLNDWRFSSTLPVALTGMFFNALSFNQPLNDWNTSMVYRIGVMFRGSSLGQHHFNQDLSNWDLSGLTDPTNGNTLSNIFDNASMDCINFSNTLIGWASNLNTPSGLNLGSTIGNVYGPGGQLALDHLVNNKGWTTSGGAVLDPTCTTLPVKLVNFKAQEMGSHVVLTWETVSETNNSHFEVEVSDDARKFDYLGTIAGNNTSKDNHLYSIVHQNPKSGVNYYRLKQVDYDGKFEYSTIKGVHIGTETSLMVFPNPGTDIVFLKNLIPGSVVEILGIQGRSFYKNNAVSGEKLEIDTSFFPTGSYIVKVASAGKMETVKIYIDK